MLDKRETLSISTIGLLVGLPLCLRGLLHCFPLLLGGLFIYLFLLLGRLLGPALTFCDTDALSFDRYRPWSTQGDQQCESGNPFHLEFPS
jgi:hypothetical protein